LKHTPQSNPDHAALEKALAGIKEVMVHVNEDKRKTEGQVQMFDIFHEIDNCPVSLTILFFYGIFRQNINLSQNVFLGSSSLVASELCDKM
jgi:hypothetical protein